MAWVEQNFTNDFVRAVMLNWALAPQVLPEQEGAGQSFYIMIPAVHVYGQAIPAGGSQQLPLAMGALCGGAWRSELNDQRTHSLLPDRAGAWRGGVVLEDGRTLSRAARRRQRARSEAVVPETPTPREATHARSSSSWWRGNSSARSSICRIHLALTEAPRFTNGAGGEMEPLRVSSHRGYLERR